MDPSALTQQTGCEQLAGGPSWQENPPMFDLKRLDRGFSCWGTLGWNPLVSDGHEIVSAQPKFYGYPEVSTAVLLTGF